MLQHPAMIVGAAQLALTNAGYLLVFAVLFPALERMWPAIGAQSIWKRGSRLDLLLSLTNPLIAQPLTQFLIAGVLSGVFALLSIDTHQRLRDTIAAQPFWAQLLLAVVVADIASYWKHRLFHTALLWPFHAVHHSATEVDWLTNERDHPIQVVGTCLIITTVMVLAGFSDEVIGVQTLCRRVYSLYTHANVGWSYGPLNRVFVSPAVHRWHHARDPEMAGKNFAVFFSLLDVIFGTYRLPNERLTAFGLVDGEMPETFLAAWQHPLTYRRHRAGHAAVRAV